MEFVKVNVVTKKPMVQIDNSWFPYRNIVNTEEFNDEVCNAISEAIEYNGRRKVTVYYNVEERDNQNRPTKILVGCKVKGRPYDGLECVFNTIYDSEPLKYTYSLRNDPNVDSFVYKRFMSPEDYISKDDYYEHTNYVPQV